MTVVTCDKCRLAAATAEGADQQGGPSDVPGSPVPVEGADGASQQHHAESPACKLLLATLGTAAGTG